MQDGAMTPRKTAAVPAANTGLRALAHPVRLQILRLITERPLSAGELARELGIASASASYHIRQLADSGLATIADEPTGRGGRRKLYQHHLTSGVRLPGGPDDVRAYLAALLVELTRRTADLDLGPDSIVSSMRAWVPAARWQAAIGQLRQVLDDLHTAGTTPHTPGAVPIDITAIFALRERPS